MKGILRREKRWTKLDNAALVFPVTISESNSSFFRISVCLKETVHPNILQKALDHTITRFPYYQVRLRQGAFWMFLEEHDRRPLVEIDRYYPCLTLKTPKQKELLFRILYLENRISLEMSHILTDGFGATVFLKNLTAQYLRLTGIEIPVDPVLDILDISGSPSPDEEMDAFHRFYEPHAPKERQQPKAYQIHGKNSSPGINHVITGKVDVSKMLEVTRSYQVSITEFLAACILFTLQNIQKEDPLAKRLRPIRVNVPANLRKLYPTKTFKNFSLYTNPEIDPNLGYFTFEETLHQVHHFMRKNNTEKFIKQQISRNVGGEINPLIRVIPLPIKKAFLRSVHSKYGETQFSVCLSNLGNISVPQSMEEHIERFDFIPAGNFNTKTMLAVTGFKDTLYLSFGRVSEEPILERAVFALIRDLGIEVVLESNNPSDPPQKRRLRS